MWVIPLLKKQLNTLKGTDPLSEASPGAGAVGWDQGQLEWENISWALGLNLPVSCHFLLWHIPAVVYNKTTQVSL